MIVVRTKMIIPSIIKYLNQYIRVGMDNGARLIATAIKERAQEILSLKTIKKSGNLSDAINAIQVKQATSNLKISRWDVVVDLKQAPYAFWIEFGRDTPVGLPYSKSGLKDYSKSSFKGYEYLTKAVKAYDGEEGTGIVELTILSSLMSKSLTKTLKK